METVGLIFRAFTLLVPVFLAACGGSTDPGSETTDPPPNAYDVYGTSQSDLIARWGGLPVTPAGEIPPDGLATYDGVISIDYIAGAESGNLKGNVVLAADFASDRLSGSADGFVDGRQKTYVGSLLISNGVLDRNAVATIEKSLSGQLNGTLQGSGPALSFTLLLSADFIGSSHGAIHGGVAGSVTADTNDGLAGGLVIAQR